MEKEKRFDSVKFSSRVLRKAIEAFREITPGKDEDPSEFRVEFGDEMWRFDDVEEFLASYALDAAKTARLTIWRDGVKTKLSFGLSRFGASVSVKHDSRSSIEKLFSVFEECPAEDKTDLTPPEPEVTIFIGHGGNKQWEKLKSHLQDKHDLNIIAYETGARAGHSIRDVLDRMAKDSSFALLVLTGEDKSEDGIRARQNVVHECGLFQGRLGFDRAILLVEEGITLASNFDGIQQLRFKKGRISETFGDVIATIRREYGPI